MRPEKQYRKLQASQANVRFNDLIRCVEAFGYEYERTTGSHLIYRHPRTLTKLNLQEQKGEAKSYQVRQFLRQVDRYHLTLTEGS